MAKSGLLLVDKPAGITSHDVVARARRILGTRKIGHAGTLDPMATGLLVLGVESGTRLLTFIVGKDKSYEATISLGASTVTDDAMGEVLAQADPQKLSSVTEEMIRYEVTNLTGNISQIPSAVSAIKVGGVRSYDLVRSGTAVELAARSVEVSKFEIIGEIRRKPQSIELDVLVDCSSGTYIRALARDLGNQLGVGGHLTKLRRTRVGQFNCSEATQLGDLSAENLMELNQTAEKVMPLIEISAEQVIGIRQGKRLQIKATEIVGLVANDELIAVVEPVGESLVKSLVVFSAVQSD